MFARWIGTNTRNTAAEFTVHHDGGSSAVSVNQQLNSSLWIPLGVYDLAPSQNHRVVLTDSGTGSVAADAIRVVPVEYDSVPVYADAVRFVANDAEDVLTVHTDQLGSPQKLTDLSRSVVWDASFTPFGEADSITGSANDNQRFPGQYFDAESGFHYNWFRDYDPALGRFIQADSIGLAGGMNVYAYATGNPVRFVVPNGLDGDDVSPRPGYGPGPPFPNLIEETIENLNRLNERYSGGYYSPLQLCLFVLTQAFSSSDDDDGYRGYDPCEKAYEQCERSVPTQRQEMMCAESWWKCVHHPDLDILFPDGTHVPGGREPYPE